MSNIKGNEEQNSVADQASVPLPAPVEGLSVDEAMASQIMQWKEVQRDGLTDYNAPVWQKPTTRFCLSRPTRSSSSEV